MMKAVPENAEKNIWGGRVVVSPFLKAAICDPGMPPFGPGHPGTLLRFELEAKMGLLRKPRLWSAVSREVIGRFIRTQIEQDSGKRDVTLNYVEGLKYTLGTTFIGRRSQGEFIFLDSLADTMTDMGVWGGPEDGDYFSLECRDGGLWISTEGSSSGCWVVAVNGVPQLTVLQLFDSSSLLPSSQPKQLQYGDLVSLMIIDEEEDDGGKKVLFYDFLFGAHYSSYPPAVNETDDTLVEEDKEDTFCMDDIPSTRVLSIPLIVKTILSFLEGTHHLAFRSLSSVWNIECLRGLRNQVVVTPFELYGRCSDAESMLQVSSYAYSLLNTLGFPKWRIEILAHDAQGEGALVALGMAEREAKLLDDLVWFLDPEVYPHAVTSLRLEGMLGSEMSLRMFQTILKGLRSSLTTLDLDVACLIPRQQDALTIDIPGLKSLSFSTPQCQSKEEEETFLQWLLPGLGCIQALTLGGCQPFGTLVLKEISAIQTSNPLKFANLTSISIDCAYHNGILKSLPSIQAPGLKRVELTSLSTGVVPLSIGLSGHEATIEELILHVYMDGRKSSVLQFQEKLPALKNLSIFFSNVQATYDHLRLRFGPNVRPRHGPSDKVDYSKNFPALRSLTVWPGNASDSGSLRGITWLHFRNILGPFLTTGNLAFLIIPFLLSGKYHPMLDNLEGLFPNVTFSLELEEGRTGSHFTTEVEVGSRSSSSSEGESSSEEEDDDMAE